VHRHHWRCDQYDHQSCAQWPCREWRTNGKESKRRRRRRRRKGDHGDRKSTRRERHDRAWRDGGGEEDRGREGKVKVKADEKESTGAGVMNSAAGGGVRRVVDGGVERVRVERISGGGWRVD
jgi:hypothetical protein